MTIRSYQVESNSFVMLWMKSAAETGQRRAWRDRKAKYVLSDSGLDSLGFAILVARLEQKTGYDPFSRLPAEQFPPYFFLNSLLVYQREL